MELRDLAPVLTADGPFVTVLLESESDVEQAAGKYELEWRNALRELAGQGVDDETLAAIEEARGSHAEGAARLVVATPDDHAIRLAVSLPRRPRQPIIDVGPLPHLLPLVDTLAGRVPYVVVRCDLTAVRRQQLSVRTRSGRPYRAGSVCAPPALAGSWRCGSGAAGRRRTACRAACGRPP